MKQYEILIKRKSDNETIKTFAAGTTSDEASEHAARIGQTLDGSKYRAEVQEKDEEK